MHIPVLLKEVIDIFDPKPGQTYVDATLGEGGHAKAILEKITPDGTLLGIDWDEQALETAKKNLAEYAQNNRLIFISGNYSKLKEIVSRHGVEKVDGILLDLGFGTHTLESSGRGFSFRKDEPLDMRYDPESTDITAAYIVNRYDQPELIDIFKKYGEEKWARRIAGNIVAERRGRPINTTKQLVDIIVSAIPHQSPHGIHPATRVFQALRLVVNRELENLSKVLLQAKDILKKDGKIIVISFHSLEDRIVKQFFKKEEKEGVLEIITTKPLKASVEEIRINSRAHSAILRAAIKNK